MQSPESLAPGRAAVPLVRDLGAGGAMLLGLRGLEGLQDSHRHTHP